MPGHAYPIAGFCKQNGKKIKTIVSGYREAGSYSLNWNGDNRAKITIDPCAY